MKFGYFFQRHKSRTKSPPERCLFEPRKRKFSKLWGLQICATCAMCWSEAKVGESRGEVWLGASIVGIRWWGNVSSNFLGLMLSLFVSNFCDHTLMSSWPASKKTRVFFKFRSGSISWGSQWGKEHGKAFITSWWKMEWMQWMENYHTRKDLSFLLKGFNEVSLASKKPAKSLQEYLETPGAFSVAFLDWK